MTDIASLEISTRSGSGTGEARALRRQGFVPGVIYGKGSAAHPIQMEQRLLVKAMQQGGFSTRLFAFKLDKKDHKVVVRDVQLHPVTDMPLHFDLMEVDKDSRLHLEIPLRFLNEEKCPGLKKGGVLNLVHHTLDLHCSPDSIPESIEFDLAESDIGFTLHFSDITLPAGTSFVHDNPKDTIAAIVPPKIGGGEDEDAEAATDEDATDATDTKSDA